MHKLMIVNIILVASAGATGWYVHKKKYGEAVYACLIFVVILVECTAFLKI